MSGINLGNLVNDLVSEMLKAIGGVAKERLPDFKEHAGKQVRELAEIFVEIQRKKLTGEITEDQAKSLIDMHAKAVRIAALTAEIMTISAADEAINAALAAVRKTVNTAIGWTLI